MRPQNQLRRGAYSDDVTSAGSIMRNMGTQRSSANSPPRWSESARKSTHMATDEPSPMSREAVVSAFCLFVSPRAAHSATLRESTVGAPAVKEKRSSRTLNAI